MLKVLSHKASAANSQANSDYHKHPVMLVKQAILLRVPLVMLLPVICC
ncbi:hypothetical protein ACYATM_00415 [Lactobacillaceae bacterium Scapto_B20]